MQKYKTTLQTTYVYVYASYGRHRGHLQPLIVSVKFSKNTSISHISLFFIFTFAEFREVVIRAWPEYMAIKFWRKKNVPRLSPLKIITSFKKHIPKLNRFENCT